MVYQCLGMAVPPTNYGTGKGGSFWYGGELADMKPREPDGFVRGRGAKGWRKDLRWWEAKLIWWMTRKLMQQLGYQRNE